MTETGFWADSHFDIERDNILRIKACEKIHDIVKDEHRVDFNVYLSILRVKMEEYDEIVDLVYTCKDKDARCAFFYSLSKMHFGDRNSGLIYLNKAYDLGMYNSMYFILYQFYIDSCESDECLRESIDRFIEDFDFYDDNEKYIFITDMIVFFGIDYSDYLIMHDMPDKFRFYIGFDYISRFSEVLRLSFDNKVNDGYFSDSLSYIIAQATLKLLGDSYYALTDEDCAAFNSRGSISEREVFAIDRFLVQNSYYEIFNDSCRSS